MKLKLVIIFFTLCMSSLAQSYISFPDSNATWNIGSYSQYNTILTIKGDSVYNSFIYKKYYRVNDTNLISAQFTYFAMVRQDIVNKKIFGIRNGSTTEWLLYNFSVNVNDTFRVKPLDFNYSNPSTMKLKVLAKDSVLINSQYRKRIKLDGYSVPFNGPEYWIEGIGSSFGIFNNGISGAMYSDYCFPVLLCFKQNGNLLYINPIYNNCFASPCEGVGINESGINSKTLINIYPNPTADLLNIELENFSASGKLNIKIVDLLGETFIESELKKQLDPKELNPGIYFLQVYDKGKLIAIEKIIKQ